MEESLRTLEMFEELINVFCNEEPQDEAEGEGRRLDGHEEGEAVAEAAEGESSDGDMTPDELCAEAKKQYADAMRFARATDEEQNALIADAVLDVIEFLRNDSTFYYL